MKKLQILLIAAAFVSASGCSSPKAVDYAANSPKLDIRQYFNGNLKAVGVFFDRSGKAETQFSIAMKGEWNGNDGTLKEHFVYNDGRTQDRMWNIHFVDEHNLTATAADVEDVATGQQNGNALNMLYTLKIPPKDGKGSSHTVSAVDWIFLLDEKTGINRIQMSKWGVSVGEMVITFQKL